MSGLPQRYHLLIFFPLCVDHVFLFFTCLLIFFLKPGKFKCCDVVTLEIRFPPLPRVCYFILCCLFCDFCELILWNIYSLLYVVTEVSAWLVWLMIEPVLEPQTNKSPNLCWRAVCVFWDTTSILRQALCSLALAFTSHLCRASRVIRSGSLHLLRSLLSMHTALGMYRAFYIPRNVWKLFRTSMDISFPRFPF